MNEYGVLRIWSMNTVVIRIGQRLFDLSCLGLESLLALGPFDWTTSDSYTQAVRIYY